MTASDDRFKFHLGKYQFYNIRRLFYIDKQPLKKSESIKFNFYSKLLYIKYKDDLKKYEDYSVCKWSKNINAEWIIEHKILDKIQADKSFKRFYSDIFGLNDGFGNWRQYGFRLLLKAVSKKKYSLTLEMLCKPINVDYCRAQITIKCDCCYRRHFDVELNESKDLIKWNDGCELYPNIKFALNIKIEKVHTFENNFVSKSKWNAFDII